MPTITQGNTQYNVSATLATLHAQASKAPTASYTPAGWARVVLGATRQAVTPASVKRLGMQYRGQLWRASANGCGRGNAYPTLTGAQVCAAIANTGSLQGGKLHTAQAKLLAAGRKAGAAQAGGTRKAKANAGAPKVTGAPATPATPAAA